MRFGIKTLLRGPAIVVRALAALLVVWTVLLALPASSRWFPDGAWQWGWVGFDIALFVALFTLASRWRHRVATGVAVAVTADAVMTTAEAALYNAPRVSGTTDVYIAVRDTTVRAQIGQALEQQGWTVVEQPTGFHLIQPRHLSKRGAPQRLHFTSTQADTYRALRRGDPTES